MSSFVLSVWGKRWARCGIWTLLRRCPAQFMAPTAMKNRAVLIHSYSSRCLSSDGIYQQLLGWGPSWVLSIPGVYYSPRADSTKTYLIKQKKKSFILWKFRVGEFNDAWPPKVKVYLSRNLITPGVDSYACHCVCPIN